MQKLTAAVSFIWLINLILDIKIIFDVVQHFSFPHQIGHVLDRTHCHYSFNFVVDTAFPTLLTKSFHRLIERNAMHPHIFVHPLIKPFSFSSPLNNFIFDNLQLSANFAEKIFHLTLFPFPLFSFHELYISSPGENSETPFPPFFCFHKQQRVKCSNPQLFVSEARKMAEKQLNDAKAIAQEKCVLQ